MDLSKTGSLTKSEHLQIAADMHAKVLDELFRETRWRAPDAVFHGGTALTLGHRSVRFSEDLDFMVREDVADRLEKAIAIVQKRVNVAMGVLYPGSTVTVKGPKGNEVAKWVFTWSHPNRRGNVQVKAEFLKTAGDVLKAYRTNTAVPTSKGTIGLTMPIPMPDLLWAWADKVKAIATRPAFKWRDAYDLAFVANSMHVPPSDDERVEALTSVADIYGKTLDDIAEGLSAVTESGVLTDSETFETDMSRWFDDELFEHYKDAGIFRNALRKCSDEVGHALVLCLDRNPKP